MRTSGAVSASSGGGRGGRPLQSTGGLLLALLLAVGYAVLRSFAPGGGPVDPQLADPPSAVATEDASRADAPAGDQESRVERSGRPSGAEGESTRAAERRAASAAPTAGTESTERRTENRPATGRRVVVENVTVRDQSGRVVFQGDVDLTKTLARIDRGERLGFRNDGSVFGNRERRLPRRDAGYYREWVHPTPGQSGPGAQRVVTGAEGEAYYTHDHYRSFRKVR